MTWAKRIRATLLCTLAIYAAGALAPAADAQAVTGEWARNASYEANRFLCGTTWWACRDFTAPRPACFGRGGGTWECYGGVTEQHKATFWRWRNVGTYIWIGRYGSTISRRTN